MTSDPRAEAAAGGDAAGDERLFPPHQSYPPEPDAVDEASEESFPASDPPSTWSQADEDRSP